MSRPGRGLLWVTAEPPDFGVGGGAIRQAHMLRALRTVFDPLDLLVLGSVTDRRVQGLIDRLDERPPAPSPAPRSASARRARDLRRVVSRAPAEVHDRRSERAILRRALAAAAERGGRYSVVHVEHLGLAGIETRAVSSLRSLDVQNVPLRMAAQARGLATGRRQRWLLGREQSDAGRFQRRALAGYDIVSVVSETDATDLGLGQAPHRPAVLVVPNGVEINPLPATDPLPVAPAVVFTGTLDYLPNVDGIVWFVQEVWPLVRSRFPAASLSVVGRRPVEDVRRLIGASGATGVVLHADVGSVAPYLSAARVAVVPVRIGTGSRLKALEAMAARRPVAGTSVGLEGIGLDPGVHALVGDGPGPLADAVSRLLGDDDTATRVAAAGRALVEQRYGWDAIASRYALSMSELASAGAPE